MSMKEIRDKKIDLRLSAEEKRKIQEEAAKRGMGASEFIRLACERLINQEVRHG
jgi:predicted DNA binding CopG/RHH family protein